MRVDELLTRGHRPVFSFEFFPPKTEDGLHNLFEAVGMLRHLEATERAVTERSAGAGPERWRATG